jgi:Predicted hydrolases or acyltransferases (alpha/beta hydrolase superfamily)
MIRAVNTPFPIHNIQLGNGCNITYVDEGKGPQTILFIHGLANYSMSWRKNIAALQSKFRCIAVDLPGNGFSDRGNFPYSISFFAACIYEMIERLRLNNLCIVGHSMGGQIAIRLLADHPDCAEKLVLCAPAGFETFTSFEKGMYHSAIGFFDMFSTEENSLRKSIYSSFYQQPSQGDDLIQELVDIMKAYPSRVYRNMIDACINAMLHEPVYEVLNTIQQPTLVLFGERDALIPNRLIHPVTTRQIALQGIQRLPNARLEMIERCGHFLQIEKADEVNELIASFITE